MSANSWACIARMGGFGDNLIASSVLPGLKKRFGHVEVISGKPMHEMFENNPYIDKLSALDAGQPEWKDGHSWQKWFHERSREYAFFANLSHSCEMLGVALKAQTAFWWSKQQRERMFGKSYLEHVHDICDIPYDEIAPNFFPTDAEVEQAVETKRKVGARAISWVMSGSRLDKIHPHADIAVSRIIKELGVPVVLMGAPGKDLELARLIQSEVKKNNKTDDGLHLALSSDPANPSWGPRRICAQAQQMDAVIGPDTGPMWAVAMREMPKVVMVSHASPENITKHWVNTTTLHASPDRVKCWPCHQLHDDCTTCTPNAAKNGSACITDITVDDIVETVRNLVKEKS